MGGMLSVMSNFIVISIPFVRCTLRPIECYCILLCATQRVHFLFLIIVRIDIYRLLIVGLLSFYFWPTNVINHGDKAVLRNGIYIETRAWLRILELSLESWVQRGVQAGSRRRQLYPRENTLLLTLSMRLSVNKKLGFTQNGTKHTFCYIHLLF